MTISSITSGACGMHRASGQLEHRAIHIARIGVEGGAADISTEMINGTKAKHDFKASAKVVGVAGGMTKALLDPLVWDCPIP